MVNEFAAEFEIFVFSTIKKFTNFLTRIFAFRKGHKELLRCIEIAFILHFICNIFFTYVSQTRTMFQIEYYSFLKNKTNTWGLCKETVVWKVKQIIFYTKRPLTIQYEFNFYKDN